MKFNTNLAVEAIEAKLAGQPAQDFLLGQIVLHQAAELAKRAEHLAQGLKDLRLQLVGEKLRPVPGGDEAANKENPEPSCYLSSLLDHLNCALRYLEVLDEQQAVLAKEFFGGMSA